MKVIYIPRKNIITASFALCLIILSVFYAKGGGFKLLNVFLNTENEIPIYSVQTNKNVVALTFDAGYGDENLDSILKTLKDNNVKATFFIVGYFIDKYPDMVKKIIKDENGIGNHSFTHPYLTKISTDNIKEEISITDAKLKSVTGISTNLFRAPFGDYNSQVVKTVKELGYHCIQWDVDSKDDNEDISEEQIYNNVISNVDKGSIVLFHLNSEKTPKILDKLIKNLKSQGYKFALVKDMIYKNNYYVDHMGRQRKLD